VDGKCHYADAKIYKIDSTGSVFFCASCNHADVKAIVVDQIIAVRKKVNKNDGEN